MSEPRNIFVIGYVSVSFGYEQSINVATTQRRVVVASTASEPSAFQQAAPTVQAVVGALRHVPERPSALQDAANQLGVAKQFEAAKKALTWKNYTSCGMCPDAIVNMLASETREVHEMVLRVKRLTRLLNRLLEGAEQAILDIINGFIDLIPYPPLLDLTQIVRTIMCPLTPQAFLVRAYQQGITAAHIFASSSVPYGSLNPMYYPILLTQTWNYGAVAGAKMIAGAVHTVEQLLRQWAAQWKKMAEEFWRRFLEYLDTENPFSDLDASGAYRKVDSLAEVTSPQEGMVVYMETQVRRKKRYLMNTEEKFVEELGVERVRYVYRNGAWQRLESSSIRKFVRLLLRLLFELYSVVKNFGYFAVRVGVTKASVALVRATCPTVYESSAYPFKRFDEDTKDFRMEGFVPTGLGSSSRPFYEAGARLILKIESWTAASFIALV